MANLKYLSDTVARVEVRITRAQYDELVAAYGSHGRALEAVRFGLPALVQLLVERAPCAPSGTDASGRPQAAEGP